MNVKKELSTFSCLLFATPLSRHYSKHSTSIDNYAKDVGPEWSDFDAVLTMVLCGTKFCVWQDMKLIFTG